MAQSKRHESQVEDTRPSLRRHVSCSSRAVDGGLFKNSYHVVYPSVVFANNNSGVMQQTVAALCREWIVPEADGRAWRPEAPPHSEDVTQNEALAAILTERSLLTASEVQALGPFAPSVRVDTDRGPFQLRKVFAVFFLDARSSRFCNVFWHRIVSLIYFGMILGVFVTEINSDERIALAKHVQFCVKSRIGLYLCH